MYTVYLENRMYTIQRSISTVADNLKISVVTKMEADFLLVSVYYWSVTTVSSSRDSSLESSPYLGHAGW